METEETFESLSRPVSSTKTEGTASHLDAVPVPMRQEVPESRHESGSDFWVTHSHPSAPDGGEYASLRVSGEGMQHEAARAHREIAPLESDLDKRFSDVVLHLEASAK